MVAIPFKQGDTFLVEGQCRDAGVAKDLTGWQIHSEVWSQGRLVQVLTVTWVNQAAGTYRLSCTPEATRGWPVGTLETDVQYTSPTGQVTSTDTFSINCKAGLTRGG
jgi:hypothetical protein